MNVIPWNSHETAKCPVHSFAQHPRYGRVKVVRAIGWQRLIECQRIATYYGANDKPCQYVERFNALVDVRELHRVGFTPECGT